MNWNKVQMLMGGKIIDFAPLKYNENESTVSFLKSMGVELIYGTDHTTPMMIANYDKIKRIHTKERLMKIPKSDWDKY